MPDESQSGLRDRLARQGEEALGKVAQELLENPLVNSPSSVAGAFRQSGAYCPAGSRFLRTSTRLPLKS